MAKNIGVCPACESEKQLVKSGKCRSCHMKAVAAEKKSAPVEAPTAQEETSVIERKREGRPERVSLEDRLVLGKRKPEDPNFVYYDAVHNPEKPGRIEELETRGYEVVENRGGPSRPLSELTGDATRMGSAETKPAGGGMTQVRMRIKREWYEADMATIANIEKKKEDDIFGPKAREQYLREGIIKEE